MTTLPGGVRLTLSPYLPHKTCLCCRQTLAAAEFLAGVTYSHGVRRLYFGSTCLRCTPPLEPFPTELRAMRFTDTFVADDGARWGWRQRQGRGKAATFFGPMLSLELAGVRRTADGVWRLQPKCDRRSQALQAARPRQVGPVPGPVRDPQRSIRRYLPAAVRRQHGLCALCGLPFTPDNPATADHIKPWTRGGDSDELNCQAVHGPCNSRKGARDMTEYRRRLRQTKLFDEERNASDDDDD